MAEYTENKNPLGLDLLASLADDDVIVVGDASSPTEKPAKGITKANFALQFGMIEEEPSGAVNGSNKVFTFTAPPKFIITEQGIYIPDYGFTLSGSVATMFLEPTQFIRGYR